MIEQVLLCSLVFAVAVRAGAPAFEMTVRDAPIASLDKLNLAGSFSKTFGDDFVAGVKYSYNSIHNAPEKIFFRKSFSTKLVDVFGGAEADITKKSVAVDVAVHRGDAMIRAELDSKNKLTLVELKQTFKSVFGRKLTLKPKFNFKNKTPSVLATYSLDGSTQAEVEYNGDALFRLSHKLDEDNTIIPQVNAKTGEMKYSWIRKLGGASVLTTTLQPGQLLQFKLVEPGSWGAWTALVNVPWDDTSKSTVSFKKAWEF